MGTWRLLLLALALLPQAGCSPWHSPLQRDQVVTRDAYEGADVTTQFVAANDDPVLVAELAQRQRLPVRYPQGLLLVDEGPGMREAAAGFAGSRAELAAELAGRMQASLAPGVGAEPAVAARVERIQDPAETLAGLDPQLAGPATAVVLFSRAARIDADSIQAASELRRRRPGLCLHLVSVGDEAACFKLRRFGTCGSAVRGEEIAEPAAMAAYAVKLFYGEPPDSDGDGIQDFADQCPGTPSGERINWDGCPFNQAALSSLLDNGAGAAGEPLAVLYFDSGSARLAAAAQGRLPYLAAELAARPGAPIRVHGHADATAESQLNAKLSAQRARAVAEALVRHGIESARIDSIGFGSARPVADNHSAWGRSRNRRVEVYLGDGE